MFGSSKKEELEQLTAQVETLQQENAELQAAHASDAHIIALHEATAESNRDTIDWMRDNLEANKVASDIGKHALVELRKAQQSGEIMVSAQDVAREVVTKRLIDQTTAEQTDQLLVEEERQQRKNFGPDEIKLIRTNLDETFKGDGTYTRIGRSIEGIVRDEIRSELIQAETDKLTAHYAEPNIRADLKDQEAAKLEADGTLDRLANDMREAAETEWQEAAIRETQEAQRTALEAVREERTRELGEAWLQSDAGQEYVAKLTRSLETEWEQAGQRAVAERLGDTVMLEVLERLHETSKAKLEREQRTNLDLKEFMKIGIDMTDIPKDTLITIYLGSEELAEGKCIRNGSGSYYTKGQVYNATGYHCRRILTLTSIGDGSFIVGEDISYVGHKVRPMLKAGSLVKFGSYEAEGKAIIRSNRVVQGLPFLFSVDGKEEESMYPPVAVAINNKLTGSYDVFVPVD